MVLPNTYIVQKFYQYAGYPKYKKISFVEWKADKPDWQTQLIGHKILYNFISEYFYEATILDYESTNNIFYISEDGKFKWVSLDEKFINHILEEIEYDEEKQDPRPAFEKNLWEQWKKFGEKTSPPETVPYIPPYNPPPRPRKYPSIPQPGYPTPNFPPLS